MSVLPFYFSGTITSRDENDVLAECRCWIWRGGAGPTPVGQGYDFSAVLKGNDVRDATERAQNRLLIAEDGVRYRITDAIWHPFLKYVEARLRMAEPNG